MERLEEGRQRPSHEAVVSAIDFLQNTRSMCAGDAQYLSLLKDLVSDNSNAAVWVIDKYIEELGDSRVDLQAFDVSNDQNYWRDEGLGDPQKFRGMLMRLCDRIGPTNLRIMIATSPLEDGQKDSIQSVEGLFDVLTSMDFVGPDNVQLLVDWSMELGLESCLMELIEYWSSTGEVAESYQLEESVGHSGSRSDINSQSSMWGVRLDETASLPPRSVRYADKEEEEVSSSHGLSAAKLDPLPASWGPCYENELWIEETVPRTSHATERLVSINHGPTWSSTTNVIQRKHNETKLGTHTAVPLSVRASEEDQPISFSAVREQETATEQCNDTVTQQQHAVSQQKKSNQLYPSLEIYMVSQQVMSNQLHPSPEKHIVSQMTSNQLYPSLEEFKETRSSDEPKRKVAKRQLESHGKSHAKRLKRKNYEQPSLQETVGSDSDSSYKSANDYGQDDQSETSGEDRRSQIEEVNSDHDDQNEHDIEEIVDNEEDNSENEDEENEDEENCDVEEEESGEDAEELATSEEEGKKHWKPKPGPATMPRASINKASGFQRFLSGIRRYLSWK